MRHNDDSQRNTSYASDKGLTLVGDGVSDDTETLQRLINDASIDHPHPLAEVPSLGEDVAGYTDANLPSVIFSGTEDPSGCEWGAFDGVGFFVDSEGASGC